MSPVLRAAWYILLCLAFCAQTVEAVSTAAVPYSAVTENAILTTTPKQNKGDTTLSTTPEQIYRHTTLLTTPDQRSESSRLLTTTQQNGNGLNTMLPSTSVQTATPVASFSAKTFTVVSNSDRGVLRLGSGWTADSPLSCGSRCMVKYNNCRGFMFNSDTGHCTPVATLSVSHAKPTLADGDLYYYFHCDESNGFKMEKYGDTVACVKVFRQKITYVQAKADCKNYGASLMSVRTTDKYYILTSIMYDSEMVWVGCDDLNNEGVYVWDDNGQTFTSATVPATFAYGEPDNSFNSQDCIILEDKLDQLRDDVCTHNHYYACEMFLS